MVHNFKILYILFFKMLFQVLPCLFCCVVWICRYFPWLPCNKLSTDSNRFLSSFMNSTLMKKWLKLYMFDEIQKLFQKMLCPYCDIFELFSRPECLIWCETDFSSCAILQQQMCLKLVYCLTHPSWNQRYVSQVL